MPNYVEILFGYYLNMLLLVLHCTLYLLVSTRGSIVLDAYNQAVQKNKYCSKMAECLEGTHVMCMYNTEVLSPRCADGKILPLDDTERDIFLDVFNGFRRDLASGKEILGKDDVRLPQARNMRKLFWDNDLATFAQAWANQCRVQRNLCHSTDHYPIAGQIVGIVRFSYPYWNVLKQNFGLRSLNGSGLSLERRKLAIEEFAKTIFFARKSVTLSMIQENVGSGHGNVYLMSVYGFTSHIGCATTSFVDYRISFDPSSDYYNSVIFVCNFGRRPQHGEPIYMTNGTGPCSCFQGFKIENCLCIPGEDSKESKSNENTEKPDQKEETENPHQNEVTTEKLNHKNKKMEEPEEKKEDPDKKGHKGHCPAKSPVVVVLPIIDVHDAALIQQFGPFQNQNSTKIISQRRQQFRNKIKERIQNAKEQYFCSHGEPVPHVFNAGAVAQDSFLKSEVDPDHEISNGNRKERDLDLNIPRNLHNIRLKPKLDVSNKNAHMFHKHQNNIKGDSRTNVAHRLFNDMRNTAADKVYVTTVNRKPVKYHFENFHKNRMLNRPLPYIVQGHSNQEPNVYISSINGKPVKLHYDDEFKKSQQPNTRDLSYDVKGFNYKKSPYVAISNDDNDQSISDMYAEEQELKDMWHESYIDELLQQILGRTGEKITNKDNILIHKQIGKDDLKSVSCKVFATDNIDPSNINNEEKTVKTKLNIWPTRNEMFHTNLNHNGGNSQTQEANRIFNDMRHSAVSKVHATSVKGKPVLCPLENIQKSQRLNTKTFPYHAEPEIYITLINGEPKKHLQNPGTRIMSYDVQGLNDELSPYIISNDNHGELLSGSFGQVQELKDISYNSYIKEMDQKNWRNTGDDITNKENIIVTKQIDCLTENHHSKVFAANNNDPSNIPNEHKTIGNCPIKNQNQNGGISRTEAENRIFNDMRNTEATKVYEAFVNANPLNYPFENFQKSLKQDTKISPYDEKGISNREPKVHITDDKSKPVEYHYNENINKSQNPSTTKFSYDVRGSIYKKSLYKTMSNDNLDQLLIDLYNEEQELKDILLKSYIDEVEQENLSTTGKKNTNRDINLTNKQPGKGAKGIVSKVFPNIGINNQNTMKTQINDWPTRNQVPLHIHAYGTDNFDYNRHFYATHDFIKPRATLINNKHKNAKGASNGYNPGRNRLNDFEMNKLRNYFLNMLKDMQ